MENVIHKGYDGTMVLGRNILCFYSIKMILEIEAKNFLAP